jgi:hypothetical protein
VRRLATALFVVPLIAQPLAGCGVLALAFGPPADGGPALDGGTTSPPPDAGGDGGGSDGGASDGGEPNEGGPRLDGGPVDGGYDAGPGPCGDYRPSDWWSCDWNTRVRVRFHNPSAAENLNDYPVHVYLHPSDSDLQGRFPGTPEQLRFVSDQGEVLPFTLRPPVGSELRAWVRVPLVEGQTSRSGIWAYWDNPSAPTVPHPATTVFSNEYVVVAHLDATDEDALVDELDNALIDVDAGAGAPAYGASNTGDALAAGSASLDVLIGGGTPAQGTVQLFSKMESSYLPGSQHLFSDRAERFYVRGGDGTTRIQAGTTQADGGVLDGVTAQAYAGWTVLAAHWTPTSLGLFTGAGNDFVSEIDDMVISSPLYGGGVYLDGSWPVAVDELRVSAVVRTDSWLTADTRQAQGRLVIFGEPPARLPEWGTGGQPTADMLWRFTPIAGAPNVVPGGGSYGLDLSLGGSATMVGGTLDLTRVGYAWTPTGSQQVASACALSDAFTVEAWVQPDHLRQQGPARIFTWSQDLTDRNVTLGLHADDGATPAFVLRFRRGLPDDSDDNQNYAQPIDLPRDDGLYHVAFVWDGVAGTLERYLDGDRKVQTSGLFGNADSWDPSYSVVIGDETSKGRPFLGRVYRAAFYCSALSSQQISNNYEAGPL